MDYLNPFSDNFILLRLWNFLTDIVSYLNPFSDKFFGKKIIDLIGDLLKTLFIPSDDYFSNVKETLLSDLETKLPYNDYITMFSTVLDVSVDGQLEDISIDNLQIGDLNISLPKFIDFSIITKYRFTWYSWVRGFTYIFLLLYHINQIVKFLRGYTVSDGSFGIIEFHSTNNANLRLGGGKN